MLPTLPLPSHLGRYLARKQGVYYFRRLLSEQPRREIAASLHTQCYREAEWRASLMGNAFCEAWQQAKRMADSGADIRAALRGYPHLREWPLQTHHALRQTPGARLPRLGDVRRVPRDPEGWDIRDG
ncbi:DUF6538 domain-containing protein [Roseomonas gilardii]|uniref:DUF6538 domain-containing protein n=1 Tax=Roseomonas gilardii TaxID=257708 RepID=UPI003AB0768B